MVTMKRPIVNLRDMIFGICSGSYFAALGIFSAFQEWMPLPMRIFGVFLAICGVFGAVVVYRDGG